jgi:hypothetical protein
MHLRCPASSPRVAAKKHSLLVHTRFSRTICRDSARFQMTAGGVQHNVVAGVLKAAALCTVDTYPDASYCSQAAPLA